MNAILKDHLFKISPMLQEHMDAVMEIEQRAYEFPWSIGNFKDCLRSGYYCCVCHKGTHLNASPIGYGVMSMIAGEAQILNICIDPQMQGQGLGRRLLQHLIAEAGRKSADTIFLEVRSSNEAAFALYESAGFNEIGQRHGYYPARDGREDALVLALAL
jgi:ribosomal-protein-alanine N-acetyltransferase